MKTVDELINDRLPSIGDGWTRMTYQDLKDLVKSTQRDAFESGRVEGLLEAARQDRAHSSIHSNPDFSDLLKRSASEHECTITRHKK